MVDKYNVEATEILAYHALSLPMTEAVPIYEQLLSTFPTAAKYWKQYVEVHMMLHNDVAAKQVFGRCLLDNRQVSLWRCYIRLIRKLNEYKGAEGQEETKKAFEFMLNYLGSDIASGLVWIEYITFLKSLPASDPQEESQRTASIRKVYQKAVTTPTHHVEQLWKDYEKFENSVSRALAKSQVSEYQPKYNSAKAVYRERKKLVDDIDWNMLAVPPTGSDKEEQQCMAWKRFLAFEKRNPQRIDSESSNSRIILSYEQCLMYLYYYPDVWYDYVTWHADNGSMDLAVKIYEKALKVLPDSELLKYAYAELEESRGEIQPAKKIYESLIGDGVNASALAHIQFIRFLRRTEGIEAARKYFVDARSYPNCTYHVFVAYAKMAFCQDKDPKLAHNVFEAGMKRFMHEPEYILEYADFLCRLNDDTNVRALFERALNTLPPEKSVEIWKRYTQFEQTYGNLASILKVEQRRKEALSRTGEDGSSALHDVVSRYSFMGLRPCSSKDLDYLARQELLAKNINQKAEKSVLPTSAKVNYPDTSRMIIYDSRQLQDAALLPNNAELPAASNSILPAPAAPSVVGTGTTKSLDEILGVLPPALAAFVRNLPSVDGPAPDVDIVLSILLQSNVPSVKTGKLAPVPITSDSANKSRLNPGAVPFKSAKQVHSGGKRKDMDRQQNDETPAQSQPVPTDLFKIRQMKKARGVTSSQTGSASSGSGSSFSGELSGSIGCT
ncbi:cleavage stimulation factor subunit 77-like [Papaver somniferum]|nr:cleavage stimulation factor subunit 77-like [Papaver somniferum]